MKISLFITCLNDALFARTGIAVTRVLARMGHEVLFPKNQTCCGQMHLNSGYQDEAVLLARKWLDDFADADVIVSPSGSCTAHVREMFAKLGAWTEDQALIEACANLEGRVFEFSEFLLNHLRVTDVGAHFPHRVTYHPTCHGARSLGLGTKPIELLKAVDGLEYIELPDHDQCCGFGGTFSVKNSETSTAMLADKMEAIRSTGAEFCAAVDNSCLMHIGGGLSRHEGSPKVVHLAEILASEEAK